MYVVDRDNTVDACDVALHLRRVESNRSPLEQNRYGMPQQRNCARDDERRDSDAHEDVDRRPAGGNQY